MIALLKKALPNNTKQLLRDYMLKSLHAVPKRQLEIANNLIEKGVTNYLTFNYHDFREDLRGYINSLRVSDYEFKYSKSHVEGSLYASVFACLGYGLIGELDNLSNAQKTAWAEYFDTFQSDEDGYFTDPKLDGEEFKNYGNWGDGWGIRHLAGHIIIAYSKLGQKPNFKFKFLEPYYDLRYLENWLKSFDFGDDIWSQSNFIMNICILLQYSRDQLGDKKAEQSINAILSFLEKTQNKNTGLWHSHNLNEYKHLAHAIRGAYHFFPLFIYENEEIQSKRAIIDHILLSQNSWGGFENHLIPSGACEDIDALDPLIRFALDDQSYRNRELDLAVKKGLIWVLSNLNSDRGFTFMPETPHEYGSHPMTSSRKGESNIFATWFRTLSLAYITTYLKIPNEFVLAKCPGYELPLLESSYS